MTKEEAEAEFLAQETRLKKMHDARQAEFHKEEVARLLDEPENITAEELAKLCVGVPKLEQEMYQRYWAEHQVRAVQRQVESETKIPKTIDALLGPTGLFLNWDKLTGLDPKTMTPDEVQSALTLRRRTVYDSDGAVERHAYDCRCGNCEEDP